MFQEVEHLPSMCEALSSNPSTTRPPTFMFFKTSVHYFWKSCWESMKWFLCMYLCYLPSFISLSFFCFFCRLRNGLCSLSTTK
jgi:hypothetical protein